MSIIQFAHLKWFTDSSDAVYVDQLSFWEYFAIFCFVVAALGLLYLIASSKLGEGLRNFFEDKLRRYIVWIPTFVRLSLGIMLVIYAWNGYLWGPNNLASGDFQTYMAWLVGGLGLLLISGVYTRFTAITLAAAFIVSAFSLEAVSFFEHLEVLGISIYLAIVGPGKSLFNPPSYDLDHLDKYRSLALPALRIGLGLSLVVLAFSEKLAATGLAGGFLESHDWNFLSFAGVSDRLFIIIAGSFELIFGLALIFNIGSALVALALLGLFSITAVVLGISEVVGHSFAIGIVLAIWADYPKPYKLKLNKIRKPSRGR